MQRRPQAILFVVRCNLPRELLYIFSLLGVETPYSLEAMPTIKVATNNNLAQRWHDLIDVNAGPIANGEKPSEEVGQQLFDKILQ